MTDDPLKTLPDQHRALAVRVAKVEDRLDLYEHHRSSWIPSASWRNLTGRQREVALVIGMVALYEVLHWALKPATVSP